MPIDYSKPEVIKFLIENYEKTARLRLRWNHLYKDKLRQTAEFRKEEKGYYEKDVSKTALEFGMATLTRDNVSGAVNKRLIPSEPYILHSNDLKKGNNIINVGLGDPEVDPRLARPDDDLSFDPIMRPVPPKQRSLIYKGIPDFGRKEYIKVRNIIKPEDKYYFQESVSWQTGWRLKDSYFEKSAPTYPRQGLLRKSLVSRIGCQPDPPHYKNTFQLFENQVCL